MWASQEGSALHLKRQMPQLLADLDGGVTLLCLVQLLGKASNRPLRHTRHGGQHLDAERRRNLGRQAGVAVRMSLVFTTPCFLPL